MRATPALTIAEINTRVLNEDADMRALSTSAKVPIGQQALRVKYPELKAKFESRKIDARKDLNGTDCAKAAASVSCHAWCVKSVTCEINTGSKVSAKTKV